MLKIKSVLINLLNHTLSGILLSGMPEFFGYINPWLVLIGVLHLGYLVSELKHPWELLYLVANCIGFYLFFHYAVPDVLDSFLMMDSFWINILINIGIAVIIKIPMFWKPIIKIYGEKYNFHPGAIFLVILTMAISFFKVYMTFGWASSVTYTLNTWVEHLIWLPIFGSIIYVYFISLIVGLLAFKIKSKFLISLVALFIFSHLIPIKLPSNKIKEQITITLVQYPYYLLNQQKDMPDLLILKRTFSKLLGNVKSDLLIFPESSALFTLDKMNDWLNNPYISVINKLEPKSLISGYKKEGELLYNTSIFLKKNDIPQIYYKNKLFPVGEESVWGISNFNQGDFYSDLRSKKDNSIWDLKGFNVLPLLCFENFHNYFWQQRISNSKQVIHLTTLQSNEGWVKDRLIRKNLLGYARIQAKEMGVYLAKADTAGPSAIIGPDGEIVAYSEQPISLVTASIPKLQKNSFYARNGFYPFIIFGLIQILVLLLVRKKNN